LKLITRTNNLHFTSPMHCFLCGIGTTTYHNITVPNPP